MGQSVSPIIADFFMEDFEVRAPTSFPNLPRFWGRYVDDTLVILKKSEVDSLTNHFNSLHPSIKFTMKSEQNCQLAMLDVLVTRDSTGSLSFQVYRKPTHTNQFLNFSSHHPLQHKLGVVRTLVDRTNAIVTKEDERLHEISGIRKSLAICGYTNWAWDTANRRNNSNKRSSRKKNSDHPNKGSVTVPYIQGVTESFQRLFRSYNIALHVQAQNSLRSLLVAPKDPTHKLHRSGVVYGLKYADCPASYVGESARPLRTRIREHKRPASPVGEHRKDTPLIGRMSKFWTVKVTGTVEVYERLYTSKDPTAISTGTRAGTFFLHVTITSLSHVTTLPPAVTWPRNNSQLASKAVG